MRFHRADGQSATLTQHSHRIFMQSKPRTPHRARWRLLASLAIPVLASCGGGSSDTPAPPPPPATALSLLAGSTDGPGNQDGTGAFAKISVETGGMALTPAGDVLMADTGLLCGPACTRRARGVGLQDHGRTDEHGQHRAGGHARARRQPDWRARARPGDGTGPP